MTLPSAPLEIGTLLKHEDSGDIGVVVEAFYFNDKEARKFNEFWLLRVLIEGKIQEGWLQDWDEWEVVK